MKHCISFYKKDYIDNQTGKILLKKPEQNKYFKSDKLISFTHSKILGFKKKYLLFLKYQFLFQINKSNMERAI